MGCFSWMFADTNNEKALKIGNPAYIICPDNSIIYTPHYDGHGHFASTDVYDLVAKWNRSLLSKDMLREKPRFENYGGLYDFEKEILKKEGLSEEEIHQKEVEQKTFFYNLAVKEYEKSVARLNDYRDGVSELEMKKRYGEEYLRDIGIDIAGYDEQNIALKYPIKICETQCAYEQIPASLKDTLQGCY